MKSFGNGNGANAPKVLHFENDKILYVRLPRMDHSYLAYYRTEFQKYKEAAIDKVVIDVRGNSGGADGVWLDIVSSIIDRPVPYPQTLAFRDNDFVKAYLEKDGIKYTEDQIDKKPLIIGTNKYACLHDDTTIEPSENSLRYDGKIYVLIDDGIFSSTLAFASVCQNADQLITVGSPSGYFGGQGIRPMYFILPNTKFILRVKKNDWGGYYHDTPEMPVKLTLDGILKVRDAEGEMYNENFLFHVDPVFKKVLKLAN